MISHCFKGKCFSEIEPGDEDDCVCLCTNCLMVRRFNDEMHEKVYKLLISEGLKDDFPRLP